MPTLNSALQIGKSALRAQQIGLNVTGNNIANVNTPGYTRKSANLAGSSTSIKGVGGGVTVASLSRSRDRFLDSQFRFEGSIVGKLEVMTRALGTVEAIFTELGGGSSETSAVFNQSSGAALSGSFNRFFNAFQDLANNPQSIGARAQVREEAIYLTDQFHRLHDKLTDLRLDMDDEFQRTVDDVNRMTDNIASLNKRILANKNLSTDVAGNLDDERDRLVDELSKLMSLSVREENDGTLTVTAAQGEGVQLVQGTTTYGLGYRTVERDGALVSMLTQPDQGQAIDVSSGKLKGLLEVRDDHIVDYQASLDELATHFVEQINAIHGGGFGLDGSTGTYFFDPTLANAHEIQVSSDIQNNLEKIAAAGPHEDNPNIPAGAGDGSVALSIAQFQQTRFLTGGNRTIEEYYSDLVGRIGAESQEVQRDMEGQTLVMEQVSNRRENIRGVSLNEEASDLILFQRAYQAAARLISTVDEMLQTVLNI